MSRKKLIIIIAAAAVVVIAGVVVALLLLGGDEPEPVVEEPWEPIPVMEYVVEGNVVSAMGVPDEALVYQEGDEPPEEAEETDGEASEDEEASEEEDAAEEEPEEDAEEGSEEGDTAEGEPEEEPAPTEPIYHYENMGDMPGYVQTYVDYLIDIEGEFQYVDEDLILMDEEPDWSAENGEVLLAKTLEDERTLTLHIAWFSVDDGLVTLDIVDQPIEEPFVDQLTMLEAVDLVTALTPADLQLPGSSMSEYRVYALSGAVMVNDVPCIHLNIYRDIAEDLDTNALAGSYFISVQDYELYHLDEETNVVTKLLSLQS